MNRHQRHRSAPARGFTMIELMITVVILSVLAAIAYPAYTAHIARGHRGAVQTHMVDIASRQVQFRADTRAYATNAEMIAVLPVPPNVSSRYTVETAVTTAPPGFTVTATPVAGGPQASDGTLTLDSAGVRTPSSKW